MVGEENGKEKALALLSSGKTEEKMRQIIEAQGCDPEVKPEDLAAGDKRINIKTERRDRVLWINNRAIAQIALTAGTPNDKRAGLVLKVKLGDEMDEGDTLFTIFSEKRELPDMEEDSSW